MKTKRSSKPSPKLVALLTLLAGKGDHKRASELAHMLWPDRKGRIPSGGGPDSLSVAMSYWLGRLRRKGLVYLAALSKGEVQCRYALSPEGLRVLKDATHTKEKP